MTTQQFRTVFYILIGLCFLATILVHISFDFIEIDTAVSWTMKYFALPILIVTAPSCYFIYLRFILQFETKDFKSKTQIQLRTIFRIFSLTLGMTIIFIGTTLSIIILTNAYVGESRTINLNAKIVDYYSRTHKGRTKHYIKIQDKQLDRIVELSVQEPYQVGQTFKKTMQIGIWGLLYSEN